MSKGSLY